jgi:hypothetical protein
VEHFGDKIGGDDAALRADGFGESESGFSGTAGEVEDVHARRERGSLNDEVGGGAGLNDKLGIPLFPERGGGEPLLTKRFFGIGGGRHGGLLGWEIVVQNVGKSDEEKSKDKVRRFITEVTEIGTRRAQRLKERRKGLTQR